MVKKVCIIGGETHIGEIISCLGKGMELLAVCVNDDVYNKFFVKYGIPNYTDDDKMLAENKCDVVGIANENDKKFESVMKCLNNGLDVIVDKPLCITMKEQILLEKKADETKRDILMLLTLRGNPPYMAVKRCIDNNIIGAPVFSHIRMSVQLKKEQRPPWFLDVNRSGGLFLDLLIHGIDVLEWITGYKIKSMVSNTGNIGHEQDINLRNHASLFCELSNGGTAVIEGQRMLPSVKGSDYRIMIAGTEGYLDMDMVSGKVVCTNSKGLNIEVTLPAKVSVVEKWLLKDPIVGTQESLRANRLAVMATEAAQIGMRVII